MKSRATKWLILSILVLFLVGGFYVYALYQGIPDSIDEAFSEFYNADVAEDQLMDPLILAGPKVVPILIEKIKDKDMYRRRYAIGAIGNLGYRSAIPTLKNLLEDPSEEDYYRCDALNLISMIDIVKGRQLAIQYRDEKNNCLASLGVAILSEDSDTWRRSNYMRRSYYQALLGKHY